MNYICSHYQMNLPKNIKVAAIDDDRVSNDELVISYRQQKQLA